MPSIHENIAASLSLLGGGLFSAVERELRMGFEVERARAFARQRQIAAANRRNPRRAIEGFGQVTMTIDPVLRMLAERQFGSGCFSDKKFVRELLRDNPELRVPQQKKPMVVVP